MQRPSGTQWERRKTSEKQTERTTASDGASGDTVFTSRQLHVSTQQRQLALYRLLLLSIFVI